MRENTRIELKTRTQKEIEVIAWTTSDYYGFTHHIELYYNGSYFGQGRARWINRTWESFRYETAIRDCIRNEEQATIYNLKEEIKQEHNKTRWTHKLNEELKTRALNSETLRQCEEIKQAIDDYEKHISQECEKWFENFKKTYEALSDTTKETLKNSNIMVTSQEQAEQVLVTAKIMDLMKSI